MTTEHNYYKILEVQETASPQEIRKAYKKLALTLHPDRGVSEHGTRMIRLNHAYAVLSDTQKRAHYDRLRQLHGDELADQALCDPAVLGRLEALKRPEPLGDLSTQAGLMAALLKYEAEYQQRSQRNEPGAASILQGIALIKQYAQRASAPPSDNDVLLTQVRMMIRTTTGRLNALAAAAVNLGQRNQRAPVQRVHAATAGILKNAAPPHQPDFFHQAFRMDFRNYDGVLATLEALKHDPACHDSGAAGDLANIEHHVRVRNTPMAARQSAEEVIKIMDDIAQRHRRDPLSIIAKAVSDLVKQELPPTPGAQASSAQPSSH